MNKDEAIQLVKDGLKSMPTYPIDLSKVTEDTKLISKDEFTLDSFGMATLVIELEALIEERYGKSVSLVGEKMFSIDNSPFRTVGTLADFILELVG